MDNLFSVIYVGDSNVTEGKPFHIQCLSKVPIEWHKDGKPIEEHFVRHSKEEFIYSQHDVSKENDMIESTLSVAHALPRHSGKYKCNIHHLNSHVLYVTESVKMSVIEEESKIDDDENDHMEVRISFEPPIENDDELKSTMMIFVDEISEPKTKIETETEEEIDYDEMYSEIDELTTTKLPEFSTTPQNLNDKMTIISTSPTSTYEPPTTTTIQTTTELIASTQQPRIPSKGGSHESL